VFRLLPMVSGRDMSTDVIASLADLPPAEARRILLGLARTHLVEGARGWLGQWRMHDLLRVYALRLSGAHAVADGRDQAADRMLKYERSKRRAVCGGPMTVHGIANELGVADKYVMSKLQKWASLSGRHLQRSRLLRHGGCWRLSEVARAKRRASGQHLRTETHDHRGRETPRPNLWLSGCRRPTFRRGYRRPPESRRVFEEAGDQHAEGIGTIESG